MLSQELKPNVSSAELKKTQPAEQLGGFRTGYCEMLRHDSARSHSARCCVRCEGRGEIAVARLSVRAPPPKRPTQTTLD